MEEEEEEETDDNDNGGDEANAPFRQVNNSRGRKSDYSILSITHNPISSHFDWLSRNETSFLLLTSSYYT